MTCRASSFSRHRPRSVPQRVERRAGHVAAQCAVRRSRDLQADAIDVIGRIKDADRRIDMVKIDDQLPQ